MVGEDFPDRIRYLVDRGELADHGVEIVKLTSSGATLRFDVDGGTQLLWIISYNETWEFSSPSTLVVDDPKDFSKSTLLMALKDNARVKHGFWCIEKIGDKYDLEFMSNAKAELLTPREFYDICWGVVRPPNRLKKALQIEKAIERFGLT